VHRGKFSSLNAQKPHHYTGDFSLCTPITVHVNVVVGMARVAATKGGVYHVGAPVDSGFSWFDDPWVESACALCDSCAAHMPIKRCYERCCSNQCGGVLSMIGGAVVLPPASSVFVFCSKIINAIEIR
jgi:hypothetical protein